MNSSSPLQFWFDDHYNVNIFCAYVLLGGKLIQQERIQEVVVCTECM